MAYVVGLLVLVVGLLVSIGLHELGHMIPAKAFGVRVTRYMIGFGPTLWSRVKGETEYGIKAIPLGGYVRLVGMIPPAEAVGARPRSGRIGEMVQSARDASADDIPPGEEHRAFFHLSTPKKLVVMAGGTFANLGIAIVLIAIVVVGIGLPAATTTVATVNECVPAQVVPGYECTPDDPPAPAAEAGVRPGDELVSYGGRPIGEWSDFQEAVREVGGAQVPLEVERDGERLTVQVEPATTERPVTDEAGQVVVGPDGEPVTQPIRFVGIGPTSSLQPQPVSELVPLVSTIVWETTRLIATLPVHLWDLGVSVVTGAEREATVIGLVGAGQIAGEIASTEAPGIGLGERVVQMLLLLASLNVALFVFNLVPLLPLDGGHVAGALWEGAKRQVARLRGRPRPAPADMARMMPVAYAVFVLLIGMGLFLVVADLVRPVTLG